MPMKHTHKCPDCGSTYTEPLLACPDCFARILQTDDPRIKRQWIGIEPDPNETLEQYCMRVATKLVHVGPYATGRTLPGPTGYCGYIGDTCITGPSKDENEVDDGLKYIRWSVSAAIMSAIKQRGD